MMTIEKTTISFGNYEIRFLNGLQTADGVDHSLGRLLIGNPGEYWKGALPYADIDRDTASRYADKLRTIADAMERWSHDDDDN